MKLIYIVGLSHSGSTLLDQLLNAHSRIMSVGELKQLHWRANAKNNPRGFRCTCGATSLEACVFWNAVAEQVHVTDGLDIRQIRTNTNSRVPSFAGNVPLLEAIARIAGVDFVVDSSKNLGRLKALLATRSVDIFPVFLVRGPEGQIYSSIRKRESGLVRLMLKYDWKAWRIARALADRPHYFVRYEDLARDPRGELKALLGAIGLDFETRQLAWAEEPSHNFAGNHMRHAESSVITLDEKWRERLTAFQRRVIGIGTWPARWILTRHETRQRSRR